VIGFDKRGSRQDRDARLAEIHVTGGVLVAWKGRP